MGIGLPQDEQLSVNEWDSGLMVLLGAFTVLIGVVDVFKADGGGLALAVRGCGVLMIALGVQMGFQARRGLTVTDEGIDVQNTWQRHHVRWDEVRLFDVVWRWNYNSRWLRIELIDGRRLWAPGFHARTAGQRETVDAWVGELNSGARAATGLPITSSD